MKEHKKNSRKITKLNNDNLSDPEFKTMVRRILKELRGRIYELSNNFNKKIVSITR